MSIAVYHGVGEAPGSDATQAITLPPCPICGTLGVMGEQFCVECGFLVGSAPGEDTSSDLDLPHLVDVTGREFALRMGENVVGREGADVLLPNRTVSRRHATITVEPTCVYLEDLGSTNGTRVRSAVVPPGKKTTLNDRTPIQFGSVKLTMIMPGEMSENLLALPSASEEKTGSESAPLLAIESPSASGTNGSAAKLVREDGTEHVIASTQVTFGRKSGNNIVIEGDPFVSGLHAELLFAEDRFKIKDAGSTNGTKLNGQPLVPNVLEPLKDGDEITIGRTAFRFRAPSRGGTSD